MGQARRARQEAAAHHAALCAMGAVDHHANVAGLASVRNRTHDMALTGAGNARVSGVSWLVLGVDEGIRFLEDPKPRPFPAGDSPGIDEYHQELVAFLHAHPHGLLVIASVMCDTRIAAAAMS